MKKISVIGASGYSGGELLRILSKHPDIVLEHVTSRKHAGKPLHEIHPNLRDALDLKFEAVDERRVGIDSDLVFTAVPHGAAMSIVPKILDENAKVVDLSGDFRFQDTSVYEKYYGLKHRHPEIKGTYGLPELNRVEIKKSRLVANPGCYPTTTVLGLSPLVNDGVIEPDRIIADSKSGVSGAGATPSSMTHFCKVNENILAYGTTSHRHLPEIEQELSYFDDSIKVSFVPHLAPISRGISTTLHCFMKKSKTEDEIKNIYTNFYKDEPFVRILDIGEVPHLSAVRGSNYNDIGCFKIDEERNRLIVVSASDNLVKGAAGQAVQNMNIMMSFKENAGLDLIAINP